MRNEGHAESIVLDIDERQADAIDRDRTFAGHLGELSRRSAELHRTPIGVVVPGVDGADGVDMAGDVVAADRVAGSERLFEIDHRTGQQFAEVRPRERFFAGLKRQPVAVDADDGQAAAVDRDAVADFCFGGDAGFADDRVERRAAPG